MRQLNFKEVNVADLNDLGPTRREYFANWFDGTFSDWRAQRQGKERLWRLMDGHVNQYDPNLKNHTNANKAKTGDQSGLFNIKTTNLYAHRESLVAQLMSQMFSNQYDFFEVVTSELLSADIAERLKEYVIDDFDRMSFRSKILPFLRDMVTYGTAVASYEWCHKEQPVYRKISTGVPGTPPRRYRSLNVLYEGPLLQTLDLYNLMLDPYNTDVQNSTIIIQKYITPHEYEANPNYHQVGKDLLFGSASEHQTSETHHQIHHRDVTRSNESRTHTQTGIKKIRMLEAWGDFYDEYGVYNNYVAEVVYLQERPILVRFEPNPYYLEHKPFVIGRYSTVTDSPYGETPLSAVSSTQAATDTLVKQILDANAMHNQRPFLRRRSMFAMSRRTEEGGNQPLEWSNRTVLDVEDVNSSIARLRDDSYSDISSSLSLLPLLQAQMQMATGDNDIVSGGGTPEYMKTGVASMLNNASNARFMMASMSFEEDVLLPLLRMTVALNYQAATVKLFTDPMSLNEEQKTLYDIVSNGVDFELRGPSYQAIKQNKVASATNLFQIIMNNQMLANLLNWPAAFKLMANLYDLKGLEQLLVPQAQEIAEQATQQALAKEQSPGLFGNIRGLAQRFLPSAQPQQGMTDGQTYGNNEGMPQRLQYGSSPGQGGSAGV